MLARKSALVFFAGLASAFLGYLGILAIARLTPNAEEILGFVGFGIGLVGSFFVLTGLGIPAAHVKRVSEGEPLAESIGAFVIIRGVQVLLAVVATLVAVQVWTSVLGRGFETPLHLQLVYLMIPYYVFLSLAGIGTTTFLARMEPARSQSLDIVNTVVRVAGMLVVALVGLGAIALAWAYVAAAVAMAAMALLLLRTYPIARPRRRLTRSYLRFASPLALPALLAGLSINIDKALIQLFWGVSEVGYYFTVQQILRILTLLTSAVSLMLFPALSKHHARNELDRVRLKSRQSERYLSMILAPIVAFMFLYAEGVIHVLLSDAFLPAANILRIFVVATFVIALIVPRRAILTGMDRSDLAGIAALGGAVVTLGLYPLLIPTSIFGVPLAGLGPEGAAAAVLVGSSVFLGLAVFFAHRLVGDRLAGRLILHVGAAVAVAFVFFLVIPPASGLEWRWFELIAFSAAFLLAYVGILAGLREFRKADLRLFLDLLNPRKMARYVSGELRENEFK
ncbi:MAG: oligosaccharide flippase family protein [Thermoplasmata archaeon]